MSSLPWDRFSPDDAPSEPPARPPEKPSPPSPPAPVDDAPSPKPPDVPAVVPPTQPASLDFKNIVTEALSAAFEENKANLQGQVTDYFKESVAATRRGDVVDYGSPTITATTSTGKELVVADARNRSWRTFVQGLTIDLVLACIAAVTTIAGDFNPTTEKIAWVAVASLMLKTVVQTAFSYIMRLRVTPTVTAKGDKVALVPVAQPIEQKTYQ